MARPPAWIWALRTVRPPSRDAIVRASLGLKATSPFGTSIPKRFRICFAWYSWIFTRRSPRDHAAPCEVPPNGPFYITSARDRVKPLF